MDWYAPASGQHPEPAPPPSSSWRTNLRRIGLGVVAWLSLSAAAVLFFAPFLRRRPVLERLPAPAPALAIRPAHLDRPLLADPDIRSSSGRRNRPLGGRLTASGGE